MNLYRVWRINASDFYRTMGTETSAAIETVSASFPHTDRDEWRAELDNEAKHSFSIGVILDSSGAPIITSTARS